MKRLFESRIVLVCVVFGICTFMSACGGSTFNDPPGVASAAVASTQNPLVAQFTTKTALGCQGQVMVEFGPDTSYGRTTAWYPAPATLQSTTILVAGMKASTTYHMRAEGQCPGNPTLFPSQDLTFTTGPLPKAAFPALTVSRPSPPPSSPENAGVEMIDVTVANTPAFFTDRDGNVIWYYYMGTSGYAFPFKPLSNGHIVLNAVNPTISTLTEIDLAGNIIRQLSIVDLQQKLQTAGFNLFPGGFHHDFMPLPNGHFLVLVDCNKSFTDLPGYPGTTSVQGDAVVDLDQNWDPVWVWNAFDYLDVNRHLNGLPDWTHSNALVYLPEDGNFLISMRHQSWVLKIDYNNGAGTGNVLWKLGYQGDFALTENGVPTQDPSPWFSFQHFPSLIGQNGPQTTLAIWDNGDGRVLNTNGEVCINPLLGNAFPACYSRATEFQIDESAMVANLTWADQLPYFGIWGGSINQLANGNVEFDLNSPAIPPVSNGASEIREVTQTANPQVIWQMDIPVPEFAYRAYRVPSLYPGVTWQF
jgi:arylsulfate sulfotransferase